MSGLDAIIDAKMLPSPLERRRYALLQAAAEVAVRFFDPDKPRIHIASAVDFAEALLAEIEKRVIEEAVNVELLRTAKSAWHLCNALLAAGGSPTDFLIGEVRDALKAAITKAEEAS